MDCPNCQADNREGARFCDSCGQPLARKCTACGQTNRPTARFCDVCGTPVEAAPARPAPNPVRAGYTPRHLADKILCSRAAMEGERKLVTVLFCDLAGFTNLSARIDPEELHHVMDGFFNRITESVHIYEGTVNQFTGDGVMALFGAPIAHEDHAIRAVAASIAIQKALGVYSEELSRTHGVSLALRIGLNTGQVVVGRIGDDLRMDYTAQGESVNVAARLQAAAAPGGVLLSQSTQSRVQSHFLLQPCGTMELKGVPEPVATFLVVGERPARARFDAAVEEGLTPFVGRDQELATLLKCCEQARQSKGLVVSLVAEAGGGKSRLVHELQERLGSDVRWLAGQCLAHRCEPLQLGVQITRELLEMDAVLESPELSWALPYLRNLLGQGAPELVADDLDPTQRKWRTLEAVQALVAREARRGLLLLVLEDLQWIDPGSQELLEFLLGSILAGPTLVLCTYRPGFRPPWGEHASHVCLSIPPLAEEHSAEMVLSLGGDPGSGRIFDRAQGNPLFLEELIRYLREQPGSPESLPGSVQDLLSARIDRLSGDLKYTLQSASVLGDTVSFPLLSALVRDGQDLAGDLDQLTHQDLMQNVSLFPEATYRFSHPLVQEAAYQGMLLRSRAELHARAGEALEQLHAKRLEDVLVELAEHYTRSPRRDKAVTYQIRAGDRATELFDYAQAEQRFRKALELARQAGLAEPEAVAAERIGDACYALPDLLRAW